mmetsp:Transcript_29595/g.47654  ORF Transcript_29595/g.47654 Transcript_29595/m.47654 type:complete len:228 (+) Transcript_29595:47-730(+)|eukprot:CAMPEP_0169084636 /NCGR_PEP_ID=MMETSP1015-20121227/12734_1 /TAXON_ID=342587 /ORGANISM="Karlodinium micrum, Strain CCMP2283" /LENGTH=227 /DNA_ID=CAMNT_0009144673 /DNA_START=34 /DNA_END=717 /DNA_ORIENTATION=+
MAPISESNEFVEMMARRRLLTEVAVFEGPDTPRALETTASSDRVDPLTKARSNHRSLASFMLHVAHPESIVDRTCRSRSSTTTLKDESSHDQESNSVVGQPTSSVVAATLQLEKNLAEIAAKRSGSPCSDLLVPVFPVAGYKGKSSSSDMSSTGVSKKRRREDAFDNSSHCVDAPHPKRSRFVVGWSAVVGTLASISGVSTIRRLCCRRRTDINAVRENGKTDQPVQ